MYYMYEVHATCTEHRKYKGKFYSNKGGDMRIQPALCLSPGLHVALYEFQLSHPAETDSWQSDFKSMLQTQNVHWQMLLVFLSGTTRMLPFIWVFLKQASLRTGHHSSIRKYQGELHIFQRLASSTRQQCWSSSYMYSIMLNRQYAQFFSSPIIAYMDANSIPLHLTRVYVTSHIDVVIATTEIWSGILHHSLRHQFVCMD